MWHLADTGGPAPGAAAFQFSKSGANSVLFAPTRTAVRKLMAVKGIDASNAECTTGQVIPSVEVRQFMLEGKIETSIYDLDKFVAHLEQAEAAQLNGQAVAMAFVDDKFVTVGLAPQTNQLTAVGAVPASATPEVAAFMENLAGRSAQLAVSIDKSPSRVADALTGATPYWAEFLAGLMGTLGSGGDPLGARLSTLEASFGEWGSLVLIRVDIGNQYLLVDSVNGALAGPFDWSQPYAARVLLATHPEYSELDAVEYFSAAGCPATHPVADTLTAYPCPPATPPAVTPPAGSCPPPGTFLPLPPNSINPVPGRPSAWTCTSSGAGASAVCSCTSEYTYTSPGPCPTLSPPMATAVCVVKVITQCTSAAGCAGCPGAPTPNTSPPPAPGPGGPVPSLPMPAGCIPIPPTSMCTTTVYYYR